MKSLSFTILIMSLLAGICQAGETIDLSSKEAKISYSIGYQVGGDLKKQQIEVRREMLIRGIQDALEDHMPLMAMEQMRASLMDLKRLTEEKQANPEAREMKAGKGRD